MTGRLFILSAPSGAGKTTLIRALLARRPDLYFSVSCTTRPRRPDEQEGRDYYFIGRELFEEMVSSGELLEHAWVFGHGYGTPARPVLTAREHGKDVLLDIDWQGARQVRERVPDAVTILILPPSAQELDRRLHARGTDDAIALAKRLADARVVLEHAGEYDHLVVNDDVGMAVVELSSILVDPTRPVSTHALTVLHALLADLRRQAK